MLIGVHRRSSATHEWFSFSYWRRAAGDGRRPDMGAGAGGDFPRGHAPGGLPHHGGGQERPPGYHPGAGGDNGSLIIQFWSLKFEVIFYILIPFLILKKNLYLMISLLLEIIAFFLNWRDAS